MSSSHALAGGAPGKRVLVVDDEQAVRTLVSEILASDGYRVITVASAGEAIRVVEEMEIAVVLSDIQIPGSISGLELVDAIHLRRPGLPVVMVTGSGDEQNLKGALDRGAAGFVRKPFQAAELRRIVATTLDRLHLVEDELRERLLAPTVASVLANAIELRDHSMEGHIERLASLAVTLGECKGLSEAKLKIVELGAILHDIGKIGIPDLILRKPGPLNEDERAVIETHPVVGDSLLKPLELLEEVRPAVRSHHERWDGAGYPDRLAGGQIPLVARIVALADSIEVMSGYRPYRPTPLSRAEIVRELKTGRGRQWDPELVDFALSLIDKEELRFDADGLTVLSRFKPPAATADQAITIVSDRAPSTPSQTKEKVTS